MLLIRKTRDGTNVPMNLTAHWEFKHFDVARSIKPLEPGLFKYSRTFLSTSALSG